ncbi:hypothetical protein AUP68_08526 [Ilyonectria robusta]
MRLLERNSSGEICLTEDFLDDKVPLYAILSHTWGTEEVSFKAMMDGTGRNKLGYDKIRFCGDQAWLDDVPSPTFDTDTPSQPTWESAFGKSRWFTRRWTLQELIAPASVEFFSKEGTRLGNKMSLEQHIHNITGIPLKALRGSPLSDFSVSKRMAWAEKRKTTRKEDKAYSLLGILNVYMPLIYGEGEENALKRLQEEIDKVLDNPELQRLASASCDGTVKIWDPATGRCVSTLTGRSNSVAWSHDARLASASDDGTVKIWDPATGRCVSTLWGHSDKIKSVAWSHDARLASASLDDTVKIWDPATGECISTLRGHSSWVWSVAWSHDAMRLASASLDGTVKIWDPATGQCVSTLDDHISLVYSVAWSYDA